MAFIPWPDGCKITLNWEGYSFFWKNVLCYSKPSFSLLDMTTLADMFIPELRPSLQAIMPTGVVLHNVTATDMTFEGAAEYTTPGAGDHGTGAADMESPGISVVITERTPLRGRSYRGRIYFTGLDDQSLFEGLWQTARADEVLDQFAAWDAVAAGLGWTHCIASEMHNHIVTTPANLQPVTSMMIRSLVPGSQRRRNVRP